MGTKKRTTYGDPSKWIVGDRVQMNEGYTGVISRIWSFVDIEHNVKSWSADIKGLRGSISRGLTELVRAKK